MINWVFSCLYFFQSAFTAATYIFTATACRATIISLAPCALNAEFHNFISRFNKISLLCGYHWNRGKGGKAKEIGVKQRVTLRITLICEKNCKISQKENFVDQNSNAIKDPSECWLPDSHPIHKVEVLKRVTVSTNWSLAHVWWKLLFL